MKANDQDYEIYNEPQNRLTWLYNPHLTSGNPYKDTPELERKILIAETKMQQELILGKSDEAAFQRFLDLVDLGL